VAYLLKGYLKRKGDKAEKKEKKGEIASNELALIYRNR
jgi:hypothetical protein